jgi:hypothetical protein
VTGGGEASMERNKRTALILTSVVLALFVGIVLKYWLLK